MLHNGEAVAIKRMTRPRMNGDNEFISEITTIGNLQHRNLVKLVGFSIIEMKKVLIYEFLFS